MKLSRSEKAFDVVNLLFLFSLGLLCILPLLHVVAVSFSSSFAADSGAVGIWPVKLTFNSYIYVFRSKQFGQAIMNSIVRLFLGVGFNMIITVLAAYPLSKSSRQFKGRSFWAWLIVITMLVYAGLIPEYLVVAKTGLRNTVWALILPGGVPAFSIVILLNFFRSIPKELEESAKMDGVNHWGILFRIFLPLSLAALSTLVIYQAVAHWNNWFDGLIYIDSASRYPLSTYLRSIVIDQLYSLEQTDIRTIELMSRINNKTFKAAQIVIATAPILLIYPFLQRHFVKGVVLGSVKG